MKTLQDLLFNYCTIENGWGLKLKDSKRLVKATSEKKGYRPPHLTPHRLTPHRVTGSQRQGLSNH